MPTLEDLQTLGIRTVTNTASVSSQTVDLDQSNNTTTITDQVYTTVTNVGIETQVITEDIYPGQPVTYDIIVKNNGTNVVTGATIKDFVPEGIISPIYTVDEAVEFDPNTGAISGLSLLPGDQIVIKVTGVVNPTVENAIIENIKVTAIDGVYETNLGDNQALIILDVTPTSDLQITKRVDAPLIINREVGYILQVTNNGPSIARAPITIVDILPAGLTYLGFEQGAYSEGWTCFYDGVNVVCTNPSDMANGAVSEVIIKVKVEETVENVVTSYSEL